MIKFLPFIILGILFFVFPNLTAFIFTNFHHFIKWGFIDSINYFKHKEYNRCKEFGMIRLNCAFGNQVFGCGKTLMLVIRAISIYKQYNDKWVYDRENNIFVKQKIHIISNVELYGVPYIKFEDVNQLIDIDKFGFGENDITLFLLDESGALFNSRQFRDNISPEFLTRLLQSRKHKVALYMTSQRFQFTDKVLREVCNEVTMCRKWWRIVKTSNYSAYDLENAVNPTLLRPKSVYYRFIFDKDYNSYNSYQLVEQLRKDYKPNMYLNTEEILATYGDTPKGLDFVTSRNKSKSFKNFNNRKKIS